MRAWFVLALVVAVAGTGAVPVEEDSSYTGSKTVHAIRQWFRPVTSYFSSLPTKTPSDVADDVGEKVTDVKQWAQESDTVQGLLSSLTPIRAWLKEKANTLSDKSFKEMYQDVKERVAGLDEVVGTWIQNRNRK